ncbi:MAG: hypothetical protein A3E31_09445 [Candidatus Rokubacteria bacterium RIFCSPHIGHO2_12_FULL_73_22]|nr:MAG: hypothetical protein A3D33_00730 [Candidatus Rokubacteria bacterium RIFCSPHIGHO2_02_FULL_73_26]OGL01800.1 MAG: hypothetical protein A3E31_09445 [Candidatus Rokubacteria bacterium RIFCSPHIGHO2_12_FULL_73_22]OGL12352.1 MAG: hypothetical protein A3I14_04950 [Candidatus Rokubacteria bacterium RIFCSPLOWO2_02_FULL_73_56]OGL25734.1 MAG: hypothetical protein A3G44_12740 [Candidatus Rokubacteria bacterium RIFCSPLOWO2_12_FULL_73_47]
MTPAAALGVVGAYAAANWVAHHLWAPPGGRAGYVLAVPVLVGIVLPAWVLARRAPGLLGLARRDAVAVPAALVAGVLILGLLARGAPGAEPARLGALALHLIPPSLAETLVFLGVLLAALQPRAGGVGAAAVASVAFGLYHFTFYPPWNTWPVALRLTLVWLAVSAVFALTRSVWAAAAFNTLMAVTGFVVNRVTRLDTEPVALAAVLAAVALAAPAAVRAVRGPVRRRT